MSLNQVNGVKNLVALALIQGGNAIIPLLLFPFLLSKIGEVQFAKIAALEAASFIILSITLYSFDVVGLKVIGKRLDSSKKSQARVFYSILYLRLVILSACSFLFLIIVTLLRVDVIFSAIALLMFPLGVVLQSSYYYQATSNNVPLAMCVLFPRIIISVLAFFFINEDTDLAIASVFLSLSYLLSGLLSLIYLTNKIGFIRPVDAKRTFNILICQGKDLFIGGIAVILYRGCNTIILSILGASPLAISMYAIAEKYIKMMQAIAFPLTQILAVKLMSELTRIGSGTTMIWDILWSNTRQQVFLILIIAMLFIGVCIGASSIIEWIIPHEVIVLVVLMIPAAVFGIMNYMFGTIGYAALSFEKLYARIVLFNGVMSLIVSFILIYFLDEIGAALSFALAELLLFVFIATKLRRNTCS